MGALCHNFPDLVIPGSRSSLTAWIALLTKNMMDDATFDGMVDKNCRIIRHADERENFSSQAFNS